MSEVSGQSKTRYVAKSRNPSGKLIVVGIIAMLIVCGAYIFVQMNRVQQSSEVTATAAGWARAEGREDDVFIFTLDVTREDPAKDAYCIIYALDYNHAEVGRRDVFVPASKDKTVRMDVPIATRAQAVAGNTYGCSTSFPAFLNTSK